MPNNHPPKLAILCDLGKVLVDFDRTRIFESFQKAFKQEFPLHHGGELAALRLNFESGALSESEFTKHCLDLLELDKKSKTEMRAVWGSIFSPMVDTIELLKDYAATPHISLVVVSDTDPWCEKYCREQFDLGELMTNAVCSYQDDVNPKRVDASMWSKARQIAETQLGGPADHVLAIDDLAEHLSKAQAAGVVTHTHLHSDCASLRQYLDQLTDS